MDGDGTCTREPGHDRMPKSLSPDEGVEQRPELSPELHVRHLCPNQRWKDQTPCSIDQSLKMEHHLR